MNNIQMIKEYQANKSIKMRNEIVMGNIGLVHKIVNRYNVSVERKQDLVQEGVIGLMKSIETFNMDIEIAFSTYAARGIKNEIRTYINRNAGCLSFVDKHQSFRKIYANIYKMDVYPDECSNITGNLCNRIAREYKLKLTKVSQFFELLYYSYFDEKYYDGHEHCPIITTIYLSEVQRLLGQVISKLNYKKQHILFQLYWKELSATQVAINFNCSADNIYAHRDRALNKLKKELSVSLTGSS